MLKQLDRSNKGALVHHGGGGSRHGKANLTDSEFVSDVVKHEMDKLEHISVRWAANNHCLATTTPTLTVTPTLPLTLTLHPRTCC